MFPNTQTQPLFPLPRSPIVSIADRTSLAMVPQAASTLESSPNSAPQLPNPPPSPTCVESPSTAASSVPNNSFDVMNQLMNQLRHEIDIMKSYQIITNPSLTPISCALTQSAMEKNRTPVEEEKYEEYTARPHFIKTLIEHPLLGLFFIEELSVDHHHNIQEILNQAYSYVLTTRHSLNDTVDLSSPCCLLNWAEPSSWTRLSFLRLYPTPLRHHGRFHPLDLTRVITLIAIPDALVDDTAKLDSPIRLNSIDQMVNRTSPSYSSSSRMGEESGLEASWVV